MHYQYVAVTLPQVLEKSQGPMNAIQLVFLFSAWYQQSTNVIVVLLAISIKVGPCYIVNSTAALIEITTGQTCYIAILGGCSVHTEWFNPRYITEWSRFNNSRIFTRQTQTQCCMSFDILLLRDAKRRHRFVSTLGQVSFYPLPLWIIINAMI